MQQQETSFQYFLNEKEIEKEKLVAEKLNGRLAMLASSQESVLT